jgi:uncharacterized C2H2 Zn-finger protein
MPIKVLKCPGCGGEMFRWTPPNDAATDGETSEIFFRCVRCGSEITVKVTTK